jgi:hypothetical protein
MKSIFSYHDHDFRKAAYLNWRIEENYDIGNMIAIADGHLSSSIELARVCLKNNKDKKADKLVFPIFANANHGIELYLKSLIWILNKLTKSRFKIEGTHDIQQMLKTVQAKILKYKGQSWVDHFNQANAGLIRYIDELYSYLEGDSSNSKMDFSRYPITSKYEDHFYVNYKGNVVIDLENFVTRFEQIREALDERVSYFFHQELNGDW